MRFAGRQLLIFGLLVSMSGCAGRSRPAASVATVATSDAIAGVWSGKLTERLTEGFGAGDTREEKQEWHLAARDGTVTGYYLAAVTFTSGDGRPYICSHQATFSSLVRFDIAGRLRSADGTVELEEVNQNSAAGRCTSGSRPLAHYRAAVRGDVLTLVARGQRQTLLRNRGKAEEPELLAAAAAAIRREESTLVSSVSPESFEASASPADVSGVWIWEHRGAIPTGDEKQEREEWHVDQDGARLSGYYDRVVREISTDGHAFKCSMATEFQIATRYKFRGEVRGNQLVIYESSYEVLEPSACDNGQRRLDAYEGLANGDEVRLIWGVGGQVLRRPRPDVPTQRF